MLLTVSLTNVKSMMAMCLKSWRTELTEPKINHRRNNMFSPAGKNKRKKQEFFLLVKHA
jgi:hypothetical protein